MTRTEIFKVTVAHNDHPAVDYIFFDRPNPMEIAEVLDGQEVELSAMRHGGDFDLPKIRLPFKEFAARMMHEFWRVCPECRSQTHKMSCRTGHPGDPGIPVGG